VRAAPSVRPSLRRGWAIVAIVSVAVGAVAFAGGCILGPKQDDPAANPFAGIDSGTAPDTMAGGCDDTDHAHEAGVAYDACPASADGAGSDSGKTTDGDAEDAEDMSDGDGSADAPEEATTDDGATGG